MFHSILHEILRVEGFLNDFEGFHVKNKARYSTGRSNVKRKPAPVCFRLVQVPLNIWTSPKIASACMARLESVARAPPQRPEPPPQLG